MIVKGPYFFASPCGEDFSCQHLIILIVLTVLIVIFAYRIIITLMAKIEYTPLNLPKSLVEELKVWRLAFCSAYGKSFPMVR